MALTPNIITTVTNPSLTYNTQDKVKRTHDHTIHALFSEDTILRHWFSRNDGVTWSSTIIESYTAGGYRQTAIDRDDNDNLYLVVAKSGTGAQQIITYRKGTVNKTNPSLWTWSWGTETTISGTYTNNAGPDICVLTINGLVCIHVCWVCLAATSRALWRYSVNGGTSWLPATPTALWSKNYKYFPDVTPDVLNNLFFFGSPSGGDTDYIRGRKAVYTAGSPPTWTLGAETNCSHISNAGYTNVSRCLSNNKLVLLYPTAVTSADLYFRKSTNASDVSTWDTQVLIATGVHYVSYSFLVYTDTRIAVYYQKTADFTIYSKESLDGGVTWGPAVVEHNVGTQPCYLNFCVTPVVADKVDVIWRNNVANPRTVYHASIGDIVILDRLTIQII